MKQLKKVMTAALSLVLCASLVAPSFAASFFDLQDAIDTGKSKYKDGYDAESTAADEEKYAIKASKDEDGRTNVTLYEDIVASDAIRPASGLNLERRDDRVVISGTDVTLDLNGHSLTGDGKNRTLQVVNGGLTLEDSAGGGKITGGAAPVNEFSDGLGGAVLVAGKEGKFTMNGGEISGNSAVYGGSVALMTGSSFVMNGGTITGNEAQYGGGVYVQNGSTFTMNGGTISGNSGTNGGGVFVNKDSSATVTGGEISGNSAVYGGGVFVNKDSSATVTGGEISGNSATNGGGIYSREDSNTTVTGGSISGNKAGASGGGIYNSKDANTTVTGGSISGNTADSYAGGVYNNGTFTMESGKIYGNEANKGGDDIWNVTGATITLPEAGGMDAKLDGKDITGWYNDYSGRWGDTYVNMGSIKGYTGQLLIKAAHDEYFKVTDDDGNVLAEVEKGTEIALPTPAEREGYKFLGWTDENGETVTTVTVDKAITLVAQWEKIEQPIDSDKPIVTPNEPDHSGTSDVEVADSAVPLASGPITRAQFIDYLWRHEGQPEGAPCTFIDVAEDHEFALALGWAQEQGIAVADENGAFQPDELVCVGAVQEFLSNFAQISDMDADVYALASLTGGVDEAVLNCDEVVAEFFGESAQAA